MKLKTPQKIIIWIFIVIALTSSMITVFDAYQSWVECKAQAKSYGLEYKIVDNSCYFFIEDGYLIRNDKYSDLLEK